MHDSAFANPAGHPNILTALVIVDSYKSEQPFGLKSSVQCWSEEGPVRLPFSFLAPSPGHAPTDQVPVPTIRYWSKLKKGQDRLG
jgi:hypothetical protein